MIWPIVVAWIHYVAVMLLIASLLGEHLALKQELTAAEARTLQRLDNIYGGAAALVLVTGIMRMYLEKGTTYYLHNGAFHALLSVRGGGVAVDLSDRRFSALARADPRRPRTRAGRRSIQEAANDLAAGNDAHPAGAVLRHLDGARAALEQISINQNRA
jgi:hypothetical protein